MWFPASIPGGQGTDELRGAGVYQSRCVYVAAGECRTVRRYLRWGMWWGRGRTLFLFR